MEDSALIVWGCDMQAGMCTDTEVNREALDSTTCRRPHLYRSHFEIKRFVVSEQQVLLVVTCTNISNETWEQVPVLKVRRDYMKPSKTGQTKHHDCFHQCTRTCVVLTVRKEHVEIHKA